MPMYSFGFRTSEEDKRELDEIVSAKQESASVDVIAGGVLRMLIREEDEQRRN